MSFSQTEQNWLEDNGLFDQAELVTFELPQKDAAAGQAREIQRSGAVDDKHIAEAKLAALQRQGQVFGGYVDDAAGPVPGDQIKAPLRSDVDRAERKLERAKANLLKFNALNKVPPGRIGWGVKGVEVENYIAKASRAKQVVETFSLDGKPSRKRMAELSKVADARHAELKKIVSAHPDLATAEAMLRGQLRPKRSLNLKLNDYHIARTLHLPLVDVLWGEGRKEPLPEDAAAMFKWIATERILDDLLEQLERRYEDFAKRGIPTLSEPERRRELARVEAEIHAAEVEEAAHLLAIIRNENILLLPPARMSAKALLGIL